MPLLAAAVIGSSVIGAGAAIATGNKAAKVQKEAADSANVVQREQNLEAARQFDLQSAEAKRQFELQREDLAPFRAAGTTALGQIGAGTADGGEFNRPFTINDFQADPGYGFVRSEGNRGIEQSAAARGGALSGGALKALNRFNSGLADQTYNDAFNRYQTDLGSRYNRLAGIAGTGQQAVGAGNAASQNFVNASNQASQNFVNQGQQGADRMAENIMGAGNARASQYVNTGNAIGNAAGTIGNFFGTAGLVRGLGSGGSTMTAPGVNVPGVGYLPGVTLPRFGR